MNSMTVFTFRNLEQQAIRQRYHEIYKHEPAPIEQTNATMKAIIAPSEPSKQEKEKSIKKVDYYA